MSDVTPLTMKIDYPWQRLYADTTTARGACDDRFAQIQEQPLTHPRSFPTLTMNSFILREISSACVSSRRWPPS